MNKTLQEVKEMWIHKLTTSTDNCFKTSHLLGVYEKAENQNQ